MSYEVEDSLKRISNELGRVAAALSPLSRIADALESLVDDKRVVAASNMAALETEVEINDMVFLLRAHSIENWRSRYGPAAVVKAAEALQKMHHLEREAWASEHTVLRDKIQALTAVTLLPVQAQAVLDYYKAKDAS